MIINIPLQIDEKNLEDVIARDYDDKITTEIANRITKVLADRSPYYNYGNRSAEAGMNEIVLRKVDDYLVKYKDQIIERAAERLAERLAKTKKAKEILTNLEDQNDIS